MLRSPSGSSESGALRQACREAPIEVLVESRGYYRRVAGESDLREPYRIQEDFLAGLRPDDAPRFPIAPLLVFINARAGGRTGPTLLRALRRAIGFSQVLDVSSVAPDKALAKVRENLAQMEATNPEASHEFARRLRIVAAGGDGTVAWVLKSVADSGLPHTPPVAIFPLGTGNDLSRCMGWGPSFDARKLQRHRMLSDTLWSVARATAVDVDKWQLCLQAPTPLYYSDRLPYSFLVPDGASRKDSCVRVSTSWNYVSVGIDARIAYSFHHLREAHPHLAANGTVNKFWYSWFACTSGWMCGCDGEALSGRLELETRMCDTDDWQRVEVPGAVRAIVLLNLSSYGSGMDLWGRHDAKAKKAGFKRPSSSDGLVEVVGLKSGVHACRVRAHVGEGVRLAQAAAVRVRVQAPRTSRRNHKDAGGGHVYLQLDGEPWQQGAPVRGSHDWFTVELNWAGTSRLLCGPNPPHNSHTQSYTKSPRTEIPRPCSNHPTAMSPTRGVADGSQIPLRPHPTEMVRTLSDQHSPGLLRPPPSFAPAAALAGVPLQDGASGGLGPVAGERASRAMRSHSSSEGGNANGDIVGKGGKPVEFKMRSRSAGVPPAGAAGLRRSPSRGRATSSDGSTSLPTVAKPDRIRVTKVSGDGSDIFPSTAIPSPIRRTAMTALSSNQSVHRSSVSSFSLGTDTPSSLPPRPAVVGDDGDPFLLTNPAAVAATHEQRRSSPCLPTHGLEYQEPLSAGAKKGSL